MDADRARAAVESATWQLGADDDDRTMAMDATLLLCVGGSTVHGLAVQDGVEDLDVMGNLLASSALPELPDVSRVEAFVIRAYRARWGW